MEKSQKYCSFCGRDEVNTKHLIAGADTYICDICVNNAMELLNIDENVAQMDILKNLKTVTPKKLKAELDKIVVSTDDEYIMELASDYGIEIVKRPKELTGDEIQTLPVLQHVLATQSQLVLPWLPNKLLFIQTTIHKSLTSLLLVHGRA